MKFKRFLLVMCLWTLVAFAIIGALNVAIDPWWVFDSPIVVGINYPKPQLDRMDRMAKAYAVMRLKPDTLIMGNSRAEAGFLVDHPALRRGIPYNLAFSGGSMETAMRYLRFAQAQRPIRLAVLNVDFDLLHEEQTNSRGYQRARIEDGWNAQYVRALDMLTAAISWEATLASIRTYAAQRLSYPGVIIEPSGGQSFRYKPVFIKSHGGHEAVFREFEKNYSRRLVALSLDRAGTKAMLESNLRYFRELVAFSYAHDIDLRIVWSPVHARILALYDTAALFNAHEALKERIVAIVRQAASETGRPAFPILDGGRVSQATAEEVPPLGSLTPMQNYTEGSHFTPTLGNVVLDQMFGISSNGPGISLESQQNSGAIATSFPTANRVLLDEWLAAHPNEVAWLAERYRTAEHLVRTGK